MQSFRIARRSLLALLVLASGKYLHIADCRGDHSSENFKDMPFGRTPACLPMPNVSMVTFPLWYRCTLLLREKAVPEACLHQRAF